MEEVEEDFCDNCRRCNIETEIDGILEQELKMTLHLTQSSSIQKRRRSKHIATSNDEDIPLKLCSQRNIHLTCENLKEANKFEFMWPGFIWYFLTDKGLQREYSALFLWQFIPKVWRYWWLQKFRSVIDSEILTIDHPEPFFVDWTVDISTWNDLINRNTLPSLKKACNELLVPKILCPFGCTAFIHRNGFVSIDAIFQRFLPRYLFKKQLNSKNGKRDVIISNICFSMTNQLNVQISMNKSILFFQKSFSICHICTR